MLIFQYLKDVFWPARPVGTYADTFEGEMHYQSSRVVIFAILGSFVWLNYLAVDKQLHPDQTLIPWLRMLLPCVGVLTLALNFLNYFRQRSQYLLLFLGGYILIATAVITGLTKGDATYVSGFILNLSLLVMAPVEKRFSYAVLAVSIVTFFSVAWKTGIEFSAVRAQYMVNDLAATVLCVGFFIYLLDKIRFSNWENARRIAIESSEKVKEAESESKAKSQFLAAMSHEIRTPMNGVLGMTQLLQSTELQPQQRQYVEVIANSGKALLNIINDILDYSKIEAGKMDLEEIDFDLDKLCLDVVSIFSLAAEKKQLQLLSSVEPGTPLCIRSDPTRLRQILLNLLGNAFKFTSEGGVSLRVSSVEVADSENAVCLKFEVSDSGIGMTPQQMGNLFQAFQQADVSTARKYGGTGLGLSISKSLSQYMGGEIGVVSEAGKGSTFWFTICCQTANPEFVQKHVLKADSLSGRRLLVADDSTEFAQIIEEQASAWGMNVDVVYNGEQALSMIEASLGAGTPYAVVLLDLSMPVCTGIKVGETMQADSRMRAIPRVLMTARRSLPKKEELAAIGFHEVMQKPFSSHYLKRHLLSALSELQTHDGHVTTKIESHASLVGRKVLVAEDNSVNQMVIRSMLKKLGVEGVFVHNGREALDYYRRAHQQFELVFMDCEMPEMDGFEATRLIREWEKQNGISPKPIIALTAHAMKEHRDLCARVGMDDHLSKPIEIDQLRETLLERLGPPKAGITLH